MDKLSTFKEYRAKVGRTSNAHRKFKEVSKKLGEDPNKKNGFKAALVAAILGGTTEDLNYRRFNGYLKQDTEYARKYKKAYRKAYAGTSYLKKDKDFQKTAGSLSDLSPEDAATYSDYYKQIADSASGQVKQIQGMRSVGKPLVAAGIGSVLGAAIGARYGKMPGALIGTYLGGAGGLAINNRRGKTPEYRDAYKQIIGGERAAIKSLAKDNFGITDGQYRF